MTVQRREAAAASRRLAVLGGSLLALGAALAANVGFVKDLAHFCLALLNPLRHSLALHALQFLVAGAVLFLTAGLLRGALVFAGQWRQTSRLVRALRGRRVALPGPVAAVAGEVGLSGRVDLVSHHRPVAFTYGFLRPRVMVSTALVEALPPAELAAVLHHERYHAQARDPFRVALSRAVSGAFPFFTPARDLAGRFLLAKELAADEYAVERCGGPDPLVGALVRLLEAARPPRLVPGAAAGGAEEAAARLRRLLAYPAPVPPEPVDPGMKVLAAAGALAGMASLVAAAAGALPRGVACAASTLLG